MQILLKYAPEIRTSTPLRGPVSPPACTGEEENARHPEASMEPWVRVRVSMGDPPGHEPLIVAGAWCFQADTDAGLGLTLADHSFGHGGIHPEVEGGRLCGQNCVLGRVCGCVCYAFLYTCRTSQIESKPPFRASTPSMPFYRTLLLLRLWLLPNPTWTLLLALRPRG